MKKIFITGSSGLIGSEVCEYFSKLNYKIYGLDNNQRSIFFGSSADTLANLNRLKKTLPNFKNYSIDIRDRTAILSLLKELKPDFIIHAAAQPSHDLAAKIPFDDFETNAVGTLNLLEAVRQFCPESPFVYFSTNKVYGDSPNTLALMESEKRYDFADEEYNNGIDELFNIDQSKHSLFGASKLSADILVQEYGRYFNMPTCCLRGGCLTGPNHAGVELHGFLSYLIKCNLEKKKYIIYGYKGKQVRDNIHSYDVATFIDCFINNPRIAEVYNLGGGKQNSCSILEAFDLISGISGRKMIYEYSEINRIGDHICYYSNLDKIKNHYPKWQLTKDLQTTFKEIYLSWDKKLVTN